MAKAKIAITIDERMVGRIDRLVRQKLSPTGARQPKRRFMRS
jgi:hypothetical protein